MANVSGIKNSFNKVVLDSKIANNIYKSAKANPAAFAAKMALVSALTKDAVNCYYYVTQSLNNKKIPEEKRGFVASLDLMNGILNVALQLTVGLWLDKKAPEWFNKFAKKKLNPDNTREIAQKVTESIKKEEACKDVTFKQVDDFLRTSKVLGEGGKTAKWLKVGFQAATMLFATQVFTKRVIVPFLSTPLAGWYKEKFLDKKKSGEQMTPAMVDSTMAKAEEGQKLQKAA